MEFQILHNKEEILDFLMTNPALQVYSIGDLDDFFWPKTIWYSLKNKGEIKSIILLYAGMPTPTLLAIYDKYFDSNKKLLQSIKPYLPPKFYAHLGPNLINVLGNNSIIDSYGLHYKMALRKTPAIIDNNCIKRLSTDDTKIIQDFYAVAYPGNWFDKRMLETQKYFGYFSNEKLVGIAGIHVYSEEYKVAALGNIATLPNYRGQQIGQKLTSYLCSDLLKSVNHIGLNVKTDNIAAIKCYQRIGFEIIGSYDEFFVSND